MLDLDMIEEMEALLTTAAADPSSEQGQAALQKATHLWTCYADASSPTSSAPSSPSLHREDGLSQPEIGRLDPSPKI